MVRTDAVAIGSSSGAAGVCESIIRFSNRLVSPDGVLVEPIPVINLVNPAAVSDRPRYWETELELDGDNITLMRGTAVNGTGTSRVIKDIARNDAISYMFASGTDTAGNSVSYDYESDMIYCSHAEGHVSNEPGTTRSPTLYRFLTLGTLTVGASTIAGSESTHEKYDRIDSVVANGVTATNILKYDWYLVGSEGGDILYPRTTPSIYTGVSAVEPSGKHWRIVLTFDTYTNCFDGNIGQTTANTPLATTLAINLHKTDGGTRTHTYQALVTHVTGFVKSSVRERDLYHPGVVELICNGSRTDSA